MTTDTPSIIRMMTPADVVTILNGVLGMAAILAAVHGFVALAFTLVLLAVLGDGADGFVARIGFGGGRLGGILDTLGDLVAFVVAPATIYYTVYRTRSLLPGVDLPGEALPTLYTRAAVLLAVSVFVALGMLRLARYEALEGGQRHDLFLGYTTPGAAIVAVSLALLGDLWTGTPWLPAGSLVLLLAAGGLMVSRRELPKLRGTLGVISVLVILVGTIAGPWQDGLGAVVLLAFSFAYVAFGPMYIRGVAST